MNNSLINPFQNLYVTERVGLEEFVKLVSLCILPHVQELFLPGNVFLLGTQGSGKSTLLALLKAEVRNAYYEQQEDFPLKGELSKFFSAGINLNTSDALSIGQIPIENSLEDDFDVFPLYFSDFCNYWILHDILEKLEFINNHNNAFNFEVNKDHFDEFSKLLSKDSCWFGFLDTVSSYDELKEKVKWRIVQYRRLSQYNITSLPESISKTKTNIGEPLSRTVVALKKSNVLAADVSVIIRIDEVDRLNRIDSARRDIGLEYRRIINKALSKRDRNISYKIALRTHAFNNDLKIYKSDLEIEDKRDFSVLDIDYTLRRQEDSKTYLFPQFAYDVFSRRVRHTYKDSQCSAKTPEEVFKNVFGQKLSPKLIAKERYAKNSDPSRGIQFDPTWPNTWIKYLSRLYLEDPLSAKLGSAWLRQTSHKNDLQKDPSDFSLPPWEAPKSVVWRKERRRLALMQLASRCSQRMFWAGPDQIISLSSAGILIFVSLCQIIWDTYLRAERDKFEKGQFSVDDIVIPPEIQSLGIFSASNHWIKKISELPGGDNRRRFAFHLGAYLRRLLLEDTSMSNPGCNGFSLTIRDYESDNETKTFLDEATSYGVLVRLDHTDKHKDKSQRYKWFLNSIYCPSLQIFHERTKEPLYADAALIKGIITNALNDEPIKTVIKKNKLQRSLFE